MIFISHSDHHDKVFNVCTTYKRLWHDSKDFFDNQQDRVKYCRKWTCEFEKVRDVDLDKLLRDGREYKII